MRKPNYRKAMEYFKETMPDFFKANEGEVITLHHKDMLLRHKDRSRYDEWRPEDLQPMTRRDHMRLHHKGIHQSVSEYEKRKHNMEYTMAETKKHYGMIIRMEHQDGTVRYARTQQQAADMLGVSRQQVYYVMSPKFPQYHTAGGAKLVWTTIEDAVSEEE